jgi:hypothetical protein
MKNYACIFICILLYYFSFAQKEIKTTGEFQTELNSNETKDQAKKRAKEGAIINALERAFGSAVFQGNSMYIKNVNTGNTSETTTGFNTIADVYVKGEVVEELEVDFNEIPFTKKKGREVETGIEIKCTVKIRAREYEEPEANFKIVTLNCTDTSRCITTAFREKAPFYAYFESPENGYMCVFLDDNETASILFPYVTHREKFFNGYPVIGSKPYLLFSNNKLHQFDKSIITDELQWDTRENMEKLTVIFSPTPFQLPDIAKQNSSNLPENISSVEFNKWLINLRKKNKNIQIKKIALSTIFTDYNK